MGETWPYDFTQRRHVLNNQKHLWNVNNRQNILEFRCRFNFRVAPFGQLAPQNVRVKLVGGVVVDTSLEVSVLVNQLITLVKDLKVVQVSINRKTFFGFGK